MNELLSSQVFYDALASFYEGYRIRRRMYLEAVDKIIVGRCGNPVRSMLDVGCGDGRRTAHLASRLGVQSLVLLDQSEEMLKLARAAAPGAVFWKTDICEPGLIKSPGPDFELVTCLWNVLGHMPGMRRLAALLRMKRVLASNGRLFLDVNNRYNVRAYGWRRVAGNVLCDWIGGDSGDVVVSIPAGGRVLKTRSHVFTRREIRRLFQAAGFRVVNEWFIDYDTGQPHRTQWSGQLVYELVRDEKGE